MTDVRNTKRPQHEQPVGSAGPVSAAQRVLGGKELKVSIRRFALPSSACFLSLQDEIGNGTLKQEDFWFARGG